MVDYTGHFMTGVVHSILSKTLDSCPTSAKIKTTNILRCKLWTLSKQVKIYNNLRISLDEALFSVNPGVRPLFFILIRPISWHFCDGLKLSDNCE